MRLLIYVNNSTKPTKQNKTKPTTITVKNEKKKRYIIIIWKHSQGMSREKVRSISVQRTVSNSDIWRKKKTKNQNVSRIRRSYYLEEKRKRKLQDQLKYIRLV